MSEAAPVREASPVRRPRRDLQEVTGPHTAADRSRHSQLAIQEQVKDLILDRGLGSGEPLPTEAELVATLGVGRNSVREAMKALQALRIVEIRHGFGMYVGDSSIEPFAAALAFRGRQSLLEDRRELHEILDLRQALEIGLVNRLVGTIGDSDLARVHARLAELERHAGDDDEGAEADRAFHDELYAALDNQLTRQLLRVFWDVYHALSRDLPTVAHDHADIVRVHRDIYRAVEARDAPAATAAITRHFDGIRTRLGQRPA